MFIKTYRTLHLKKADFIICKLYFNKNEKIGRKLNKFPAFVGTNGLKITHAEVPLVAQWWRIHLPCGRHGFDPWSRKIARATERRSSLCSRAGEPLLRVPPPKACAPQQEKPAWGKVRALQLENSPQGPWLEKSPAAMKTQHSQRQTVKNNNKSNFKITQADRSQLMPKTVKNRGPEGG